jgi:hypothetical protein
MPFLPLLLLLELLSWAEASITCTGGSRGSGALLPVTWSSQKQASALLLDQGQFGPMRLYFSTDDEASSLEP